MTADDAHTTDWSAHMLTAQQQQQQPKKKTRATQKSQPFGKWRFREEEVRRINGPKAEKNQTERFDKDALWSQTVHLETPLNSV